MNPEILLLIFAFTALAIYAVFGGADFGAGVWEINTRLRASAEEKALLYHAIGPVWEANHVWLIFVLMVLWNGFPLAFATICQLAWFPLILALVGIVFRGAAYAFRSSLAGLPRQQKRWEGIFAVASTAAPFFMGCAIGIVARNHEFDLESGTNLTSNWYASWLTVSSLFFGFYAVGICSFLASVFLLRESHQLGHENLEKQWRRRAQLMAAILGIFALAGLLIVRWDLPTVWQGIVQRSWPVVVVSNISGLSTIVLIGFRRYSMACLTAASAVVTVLAGWLWAQYPFLVIPHVTVDNSMAPRNVIVMMNWAIAIGLVLVIPSLGWLFYLFKHKKRSDKYRDS